MISIANRLSISLLMVVSVSTLQMPAFINAQQTEGQNEEENLLKEGLPLTPERMLKGSFTEGSWISLDVSPDGEVIVFDFLGDLYTMPFSGGVARNVTRGMAFDGQPRFSPDGESIVFISDRSGGDGIWTISLDGSDTTRITTGDNSA
ncbi:uncharacterized protein METZ01_LOCUS223837, partial [marine metagenome]